MMAMAPVGDEGDLNCGCSHGDGEKWVDSGCVECTTNNFC